MWCPNSEDNEVDEDDEDDDGNEDGKRNATRFLMMKMKSRRRSNSPARSSRRNMFRREQQETRDVCIIQWMVEILKDILNGTIGLLDYEPEFTKLFGGNNKYRCAI